MKHILKKYDMVSTIFLTVTPLLTVILTWYYFKTETFNPWFILLFLFFYFATGMSITGGYHRLFAHKSYDAHPVIRFLYIMFGAGAFQNSVKKWAIDHRIHHRYVDQDRDPYCIKKGFWYAHFMWMCEKSDHRETAATKSYGRDFEKDWMIVWQDKYYVVIASFMSFVLPMTIGYFMGSALGGLVFGGLLRMVIVHHFTFFINSLCHYWGYQPYTDENTAKDNDLLALFTYGEGYHNFHHIFHNDYRNGIRWWHYDPTKWMIKSMSWANMVTNLKRTPDYEIFKAKMVMLEKRRLRKAKNNTHHMVDDMVASFKAKADEAHQRWEQLKKDYELLAADLKHKAEDYKHVQMEKFHAMQRDMAAAREEFQLACQQWKRYLKNPAYA